jgi:CxxC motif-containing protein
MICIVCPNGCRLTVEKTPEGFSVSGNRCKRGLAFAETEMTNPTRTLTTTVRTVYPGVPVLPVRTAGEIPKGKIPELMQFLNTVIVKKALGIGDAAAENVLGLGINVIVTSNVLKEVKNDEC